jgi:hypothetical protein
MNGFLLLLVHEMDDCPIGLYDSPMECRNAAKERRIESGLDYLERAVLDTDASTPLGFVMIQFAKGKPITRTILKWKD